jgi:hypothetical protein
MVRKIIGLINNLTILMKVFPRNSEKVAPISNSCPKNLVFMGSSSIFLKPIQDKNGPVKYQK